MRLYACYGTFWTPRPPRGHPCPNGLGGDPAAVAKHL